MAYRRRSLLQAEILIQLRKSPAKTITELAARVDTSRPSVSRSLRTLKDQRLVIRDKNGWRLSKSGETEAQKAEESLREAAQELEKMAARTTEAANRLAGDFTTAFAKSELIAKQIDLYVQPLFDLYRRDVAKINQGIDEMMKGLVEIGRLNLQTRLAEIGKQISKTIEDAKADSQIIAPFLAEASFWFTPSMTVSPHSIVERGSTLI